MLEKYGEGDDTAVVHKAREDKVDMTETFEPMFDDDDDDDVVIPDDAEFEVGYLGRDSRQFVRRGAFF